MLDPKPLHNFHEDIENTIKLWKKDLSFEYLILSYVRAPVPNATLSSNTHNEVNIPLPFSPNPYKDWSTWFSSFLAEQISILAKEQKVKLYVKNQKGYLVEVV